VRQRDGLSHGPPRPMTADPRSAAIDESSWRYPGWRVVAAMFVLATGSFGVSFYGLAVYLVAMHDQHGWPIARIASLYTLYHLVGAGLLVFVGSVIARFGGRLRSEEHTSELQSRE